MQEHTIALMENVCFSYNLSRYFTIWLP